MRILTKTIKLYPFQELSQKAKEKALKTFAETIESADYESTVSACEEIAKALGFNVRLEYRGFGSQGDGARILGTWRAEDVAKEAPPFGPEYVSAWQSFREFANAHPAETAELSSSRSHYCHENTVVYDLQETEADSEEFAKFVKPCKALMCQFYRAIEEEDTYLHSEAYAVETFDANGAEFEASGKLYE